MPVTVGDHRILRQVELPDMIRTGRSGVADRVDHNLAEVARLQIKIRSGVQACQQQHVFDEMRHAIGFGLHARHRVRRLGGQLFAVAPGQFRIPADGCQRIAQLV